MCDEAYLIERRLLSSEPEEALYLNARLFLKLADDIGQPGRGGARSSLASARGGWIQPFLYSKVNA